MTFDRKKVFLAKTFLGITAFVAAINVLDWRAVWDVAGRLTIPAVLLVLITILAEFPFLAWRWHLIVREESSEPARRHFETYFIGTYLGAFTPGHVGTDVYRFVSMRTQGVGTSPIVTMLLRERVLGLIGYLLFLLITAFIALEIDERIPAEARGFLLLCIVASVLGVVAIIGGRYVIFYLMRLVRIGPFLNNLLNLIDRAFRFHHLPETAQLLGLTMIGDATLWVLAFYIVARALGVDISFFLMGAMVIVVELVRLVPLTIQGIGVREAAFAALFALVGQDPATGFVISTVCFVLLNVATLIVGLSGYALAFSNRRIAEAPIGDR